MGRRFRIKGRRVAAAEQAPAVQARAKYLRVRDRVVTGKPSTKKTEEKPS